MKGIKNHIRSKNYRTKRANPQNLLRIGKCLREFYIENYVGGEIEVMKNWGRVVLSWDMDTITITEDNVLFTVSNSKKNLEQVAFKIPTEFLYMDDDKIQDVLIDQPELAKAIL